jgi:phenylalanyl-tRNA synthetase beta chain
MKFTISSLKDQLETEASRDEIFYALTDLGLEVEEVQNPLTGSVPSVSAG